MVKAYPIDSNGDRIGKAVSFNEKHWDRMVLNNGDKLRYEKDDGKSKPSSVELLNDNKAEEAKTSTTEAKSKTENKKES